MPTRRFYRASRFCQSRCSHWSAYQAGLKVVAVLAVTLSLGACAGTTKLPFGITLPFSTSVQPVAATVDTSTETAGSPSAVAVAPLDPLTAPPPAATSPSGTPAATDPLLVPAPSAAAQKTDGSLRVPLGTIGVAAPAAAPLALTQPPVKPAPAPVAAAAPTPAVPAAGTPKMPPAAAIVQPRPTPATMAPMPAGPTPANPAPRVLRVPASRAATVMVPDDTPRSPAGGERMDDGGQDTVVISSATTRPVLQGREFVPAAVIPGQLVILPSRGLGDIPLTAAQKNVMQRFETLRRLQAESLITQDEYTRRRNANIGALLPYTHDPAGVGLERSVPGTDAVVARLAALRRAFEMRAISATQHALERTMILNALLPEMPEERTERKPPPADVIEGAALAGHLQGLHGKNLITAAELEAEQSAIEHVLRTGLLPSQELASKSDKKMPAKASTAAKPKAAPVAEADPTTAEITGPVLHLASFRTEASAKQAWQDVIAQNKATLGSLKPIIRKIDMGPEKGIFYRLMAGTFNTVADAESVCVQLKQNNQFCRASADGS